MGHFRIIVLSLLAGCITAVPQSEPFVGEGSWQEPTGDLWVVWSYGCGFCSGRADQPEFWGLAYYEGGAAMTFAYSRSDGGLQFDVPARYHAPLQQIFAGEVYANHANIRVHQIGVETIQSDSFEEKLRFHESRGVTSTQYESGITDCGPDLLVLHDQVSYVGCGWQLNQDGAQVWDALRALERWMIDP